MLNNFNFNFSNSINSGVSVGGYVISSNNQFNQLSKAVIPPFQSFTSGGSIHTFIELTQGGQISINKIMEAFKDNQNFFNYYVNNDFKDYESHMHEEQNKAFNDFLSKVPERFKPNDNIKVKTKNKKLSFNQFMKEKEKENLKEYRKYLIKNNKFYDAPFFDLKDRLKFNTQKIKSKLPINFSEIYFSEFLKLNEINTDLEKEYKVNKFYKTLTDYREVEKYLEFMKKEVDDVKNAKVDLENINLERMRKIVIEGLDNEVQIIEKYCLNLKLNSNFEDKFKDKVKKI